MEFCPISWRLVGSLSNHFAYIFGVVSVVAVQFDAIQWTISLHYSITKCIHWKINHLFADFHHFLFVFRIGFNEIDQSLCCCLNDRPLFDLDFYFVQQLLPGSSFILLYSSVLFIYSIEIIAQLLMPNGNDC